MQKLLLSFAASLACLPCASAGVITVGPAGDFTDIQGAIDAASPGDKIIVEPGNYGSFVLDKGVDVLGPGSALALVTSAVPDTSAIVIRDLAAQTQVVVSGFGTAGVDTDCQIWPVPNPFGAVSGPCLPILEISDCQGIVTLQDVQADGSTMPGKQGAGLNVIQCAQVQIYGCQISGDWYELNSISGTQGVSALNSNVRIVDSVITGGGGTNNQIINSPGAGIRLTGSNLELWRSDVVGGVGGTTSGLWTGGPDASPGGPGIEAFESTLRILGGPGTFVRAGTSLCFNTESGPCGAASEGIQLKRNSTLEMPATLNLAGGQAGCDAGAICTGLVFGAPFTVDGTSSVVTTANVYPSLGSDSMALPLGSFTMLDFAGEAGAVVRLGWSPQLGHAFPLPGTLDSILLAPQLFKFVGSVPLDATGAATVPLQSPSTPGLLGLTVHLQGIQFGTYTGLTNPWHFYLR